MTRKIMLLLGILPIVLFMSCLFFYFAIPVFTPSVAWSDPVLILDAGHGGEDGGAVSLSGTAESQINLQIALKTRDLLAWCGVSPVMLREEDISLHDPSAITIREKKVSDLKNRASQIEHTAGAILVSIHQNSFPEPRYRGNQVFYAMTDDSQQLAQVLSESFSNWLSSATVLREIKPISENVYLMNHISCPAVLIECGFLSNPEEETMLLTDSYQKRISAAITAGYLNFEFLRVQD